MKMMRMRLQERRSECDGDLLKYVGSMVNL